MRQRHIAGEKMFVAKKRRQYGAGQTVEIFDPTTGEVRSAQIFVAVLGASRLEMFHQIDKPALSPLPAETYEYAEWKGSRIAAKIRHDEPDLRAAILQAGRSTSTTIPFPTA